MSTAIKFAQGTARTTVTLSHGESLSRIKAFAIQIQPYTHAEIRRVTATVGSQMSNAAKNGDFQSLRHYAEIFLRQHTTQKLYCLKLPAPDYDMFQDGQADDLILKPSIGEILAAYYSTLAGSTFDYDQGAFVGANV